MYIFYWMYCISTSRPHPPASSRVTSITSAVITAKPSSSWTAHPSRDVIHLRLVKIYPWCTSTTWRPSISIWPSQTWLRSTCRKRCRKMRGWRGSSINQSIVSVILSAVNSLWPSDAIWRQRSGSTLAQVMAWCLTAPSHCLNQCWLIISMVQWHSYEGSFTRDTSAIEQ